MPQHRVWLVVMPMVWATLFFLAFCVVALGGAVRLARGGSGLSITGPRTREVDYDNPYGLGAYFWTNRRLPQGTQNPPASVRVTDDANTDYGFAHGWYGFAQNGALTGASENAVPERVPLDTAYRAAYYLVEQYVAMEETPDEGLLRFQEYLRANPGRWDDWKQSVLHVLKSPRTDDPLVENLDGRD